MVEENTTDQNEVWQTIDVNPNYMISNYGRVKSLNYMRTGKEHILASTQDRGGYIHIPITVDGKRKWFRAHRLVAIAFIPNPDNKEQIDHIDGTRDNNHVSNLRWATRSENFMNPITRERKSESLRKRNNTPEQITAREERNKQRVIEREQRLLASQQIREEKKIQREQERLTNKKSKEQIEKEQLERNELYRKINGKRVYMIDPSTGDILNVFYSASEAARTLNTRQCTISKCCLGEQHTHKGFRFIYFPKSIIVVLKSPHRRR